jgi:hypothetical protein
LTLASDFYNYGAIFRTTEALENAKMAQRKQIGGDVEHHHELAEKKGDNE